MTIVGDWGTTRLRLFRLKGHKVAERLDGPGIGQLTNSPAATLWSAVVPWVEAARTEGVTLCGMAGSRNGLVEVPYVTCPAGLDDWAAGIRTVEIEGMSTRVASGLSTVNFAGRADVMRGEECQIFGAMAIDRRLAKGRALIVLPGTHSKWAELVDGRIVRFHTFPTGELFALLRDHSTLTRAGSDRQAQEQGFTDGLGRAPDGLAAGLFEARAAQLIEGRSLGWALGLISGLLIGSEFREAVAMLGQGPDVITMIGDPGLCALYGQAAACQGISISQLDGDACAIAGLIALNQGIAR